MNKRIKTRWLKALRSGKYKQGQRVLRDENKFCCLGVLCDLYARSTKTRWKKRVDGTFLMHKDDKILPRKVWRWAELPDYNPILKSDGRNLAAINDCGVSFSTIAKLIEADL